MSAIGAQTVITPPNNKYTAAEDVQLGREAAAEVEKQLPMLSDAAIATYVETIGRRLAGAIPAELRHTEFRYTFQVVNVREINAFALPGGPMYLNRGMIAAAQTEAEMAGVMAHELSHVALRHGTAQTTKATKYEIGTLLGAVIGFIIGGPVGGAVAQGAQFGLGTAFLRFGREFEKQADLLGARIMADAGYDPIAMATMFKTIEAQDGAGGPEWLSSHPNPGARSEHITREAALLTVRDAVRDTRGFTTVQTRLARMTPAPTAEAATRDVASGRGSTPRPQLRRQRPLSKRWSWPRRRRRTPRMTRDRSCQCRRGGRAEDRALLDLRGWRVQSNAVRPMATEARTSLLLRMMPFPESRIGVSKVGHSCSTMLSIERWTCMPPSRSRWRSRNPRFRNVFIKRSIFHRVVPISSASRFLEMRGNAERVR